MKKKIFETTWCLETIFFVSSNPGSSPLPLLIAPLAIGMKTPPLILLRLFPERIERENVCGICSTEIAAQEPAQNRNRKNSDPKGSVESGAAVPIVYQVDESQDQ